MLRVSPSTDMLSKRSVPSAISRHCGEAVFNIKSFISPAQPPDESSGPTDCLEKNIGNASRKSQERLLPLEQGANAAEACYGRSYFSALLRLVAQGRRVSVLDLDLIRPLGSHFRAEIAPKAVLHQIKTDTILQAELRRRLDETLDAQLRPAAECPGYYVLLHQTETSGGAVDRNNSRGQLSPLLVRSGWSIWTANDGKLDCDRMDSAGGADPCCSLSRELDTWFLDIHYLKEYEDSDGHNGWPILKGAGVGRLSGYCDGFSPSDRLSTADAGTERLWNTVLGYSHDLEVADSGRALTEDSESPCMSAAHQVSIRCLLSAARLSAALLFLSNPGILTSTRQSEADTTLCMEALPSLLLALLRPGSGYPPRALCCFVDVPVRFAPGIDLDVGLSELETHIAARPTLLMQPIAVINNSDGSSRQSRVFLSHAWLQPVSNKVAESAPDISTRQPCWFLAVVRDGSCRAAIYRPSEAGPTPEWVREELTLACKDASRALLLRAMHASRRINTLVAPLGTCTNTKFGGSEKPESDFGHAAKVMVEVTSDLAPEVKTQNEEISEWMCPKVHEISLQVTD